MTKTETEIGHLWIHIDSVRSPVWRVVIDDEVFEDTYRSAGDAVFGAMRKRARLDGVDAITVQRIHHRELVMRAIRKRGEYTTALAKKHARMLLSLKAKL